MLEHVDASRFDEGLFSGRTKPCLAACQRDNGNEIEMVIKLREGCDMKERSLLTEAVAAMLAKDLGLPVPEPFLVNVSPEFAESVTDDTIRDLARNSLGWNFGSRNLPPGYSIWPNGASYPELMIPVLAEILAFDIIIANDDRRPAKPNCLTDGNNVAIIDHEAAFFMDGIIGWRPPWETAALGQIKHAAKGHLFYNLLNGATIHLDRFVEAFSTAISKSRLQEYREALPPEWVKNVAEVDEILSYVAKVRDNVTETANLIIGVLK